MTSAEKPIWWQVGLRAMRSAAARAFGIHSRTGEPAGRSMAQARGGGCRSVGRAVRLDI